MKHVILITIWGIACQKYTFGDKSYLSAQYNFMEASEGNINKIIQNIISLGFEGAAYLYQDIYYEIISVESGYDLSAKKI